MKKWSRWKALINEVVAVWIFIWEPRHWSIYWVECQIITHCRQDSTNNPHFTATNCWLCCLCVLSLQIYVWIWGGWSHTGSPPHHHYYHYHLLPRSHTPAWCSTDRKTLFKTVEASQCLSLGLLEVRLRRSEAERWFSAAAACVVVLICFPSNVPILFTLLSPFQTNPSWWGQGNIVKDFLWPLMTSCVFMKPTMLLDLVIDLAGK